MLNRRSFLKRAGVTGLVVVVPGLVAPNLYERTRSYFFGGMAVQDDTAWLQGFMDAGGGTIPSDKPMLYIRDTIHMPSQTVLRGGIFKAPRGIDLTGEQFVFMDNLIYVDNGAAYGYRVPMPPIGKPGVDILVTGNVSVIA